MSGLAKGVMVQPIMLLFENGGEDNWVIGTGLDVFYPRSNKQLQRRYMSGSLDFKNWSRPKVLRRHHSRAQSVIAGTIVAEAFNELVRSWMDVPGQLCSLFKKVQKLVTSGKRCPR